VKRFARVLLPTLAITLFLQAISFIVSIYFNHSLNNQIIFGLVGSNLIAIIVSILILVAVIFIFWSDKYLFLLAGGILSNILDRLFYYGVVDYIQLSFWPTLNLADIIIFLGACVILIKTIKKESR